MEFKFLYTRNYILSFSVLVLISGCFFNKKDKSDIEEIINEEELIDMPDSTLIDSTGLLFKNAEPFYPLQETIDDIQEEMADLRARIIDYESRVRSQDNSIDILHKIQYPHLTHEIELTNGTLVNGNIVQENSDRMIVKTQIGQLTLDKADISNIKEIASINADVIFTDEPEEKINVNYHIYSGTVQNKGLETASFVRVIFKLWSSETELIAIDSSFIDGNQIIYRSGINTDTALRPGESGEYVVNIKTPVDSNVQYITRDIHWELYK